MLQRGAGGGTTPLAMRALASPRLGAEQGALVECGGTGRLALSSQLDTALTVAQWQQMIAVKSHQSCNYNETISS